MYCAAILKKEICGIIRYFICIAFLSIYAFTLNAQSDTITNSFEQNYKLTRPGIHYKYDDSLQIHDYSDNWDLDNDGKNDEVFFVGNGGAHMYYSLRIILSSDNKIRNYFFIESDFPLLPASEMRDSTQFDPVNHLILFDVRDLNGDEVSDLFIRLDDDAYRINKHKLNNEGVTSKLVVISFIDGKPVFSNFEPNNQ